MNRNCLSSLAHIFFCQFCDAFRDTVILLGYFMAIGSICGNPVHFIIDCSSSVAPWAFCPANGDLSDSNYTMNPNRIQN